MSTNPEIYSSQTVSLKAPINLLPMASMVRTVKLAQMSILAPMKIQT